VKFKEIQKKGRILGGEAEAKGGNRRALSQRGEVLGHVSDTDIVAGGDYERGTNFSRRPRLKRE